MNNLHIISAAGGNATAIQVLELPLSRKNYELRGKGLMELGQQYNVEQCGFLVLGPENHFEMSGGEFCGNAARSVALLISQIDKKSEVSFTMSGYSGTVKATISNNANKTPTVKCIFTDLDYSMMRKSFTDENVTIVDLGGIVHVIFSSAFPLDSYEKMHRSVVDVLDFSGRSAVGVVWLKSDNDRIAIDPVVWVRAVDTFYYETSCGSASIAVAIMSNKSLVDIYQPSGQSISVRTLKNTIELESIMEVIYCGNFN